MFLKGAEPATALSACLIVFLHISNTNSAQNVCVMRLQGFLCYLTDSNFLFP